MCSVGDVAQPTGVHARHETAGPAEHEIAVRSDGGVEEIARRRQVGRVDHPLAALRLDAEPGRVLGEPQRVALERRAVGPLDGDGAGGQPGGDEWRPFVLVEVGGQGHARRTVRCRHAERHITREPAVSSDVPSASPPRSRPTNAVAVDARHGAYGSRRDQPRRWRRGLPMSTAATTRRLRRLRRPRTRRRTNRSGSTTTARSTCCSSRRRARRPRWRHASGASSPSSSPLPRRCGCSTREPATASCSATCSATCIAGCRRCPSSSSARRSAWRTPASRWPASPTDSPSIPTPSWC